MHYVDSGRELPRSAAAFPEAEDVAARIGLAAHAQKYAALAALTRRSFNDLFWNEQAGCLYDCISAGRSDPAMRPKQILA